MSMPLDFSTMVTSAQAGEVLKPVTQRMLLDPSFEGFPVPVEPWTPRPFDGWFHPSTHGAYTVRQLYLYLTRQDVWDVERMDLTGVLAVTAGKFWHKFLQMLWLDDGVMVRDEYEIRVSDINLTGHTDGLLKNGDACEIKSINEFQIHKIDNEIILREKKPGYWCQSQDYLDALGLDVMRYFNIHPAWPFPMTEFTVKADKAYQAKRRAEYRMAKDLADRVPDGSAAVGDKYKLPVCCAPRSKQAATCPARFACPIGQMR